MSKPDHFYITTTLPYVNAKLHLGHALELVRADIIARFKHLSGCQVFFNTGTDEHGQKVYQKALEEGLEPQAYVDRHAQNFKQLIKDLNLWPEVNFIRTTDRHHIEAAQTFWRQCQKNDDIYKAEYEVLYCVGCELEKSLSDLVDGQCPDHPGQPLEKRQEENYFFRFSKYQQPLLELYQNRPDFVIPAWRQKEIKEFVSRGLSDFSISRLKTKMPWGVPVPDDDRHVMYVWFDALVNYVSAIGWPTEPEQFKRWWPVTQYAGKDNLRQQAAMWQAMLLSVGLEPSQRIVINGFVISGGQKMSKTIGNVLDPYDLIEEYGRDALRYYIARELQPFEDCDVAPEKFREAYNANLANGLGNLVSRIMKMAESHLSEPVAVSTDAIPQAFKQSLESFNIQAAADLIWKKVAALDSRIQTTEPFKLIKTDPSAAQAIIQELVSELYIIGCMLQPIMPKTSEQIIEAVRENRKPTTLFVRK